MYGELQSCPTWSSRRICLRTFSLASTRIICEPPQASAPHHDIFRRGIKHTFRAMTTLVVACMTLETVPPFPAPSSFNGIKSSLRKSSRNSRPISRVSVRLPLRVPNPWASPSDCFETGLGVGFKARPLTFLRFNVRALNWSVMAEIGLFR